MTEILEGILKKLRSHIGDIPEAIGDEIEADIEALLNRINPKK